MLAFALLSQGLSPKRFAGLFSAAPAVALAGLTIVILDKGVHDAHKNTLGMIAGGVGMVVYAASVIPLLRRLQAARAAALGIGAWIVAATVAALPVMLG